MIEPVTAGDMQRDYMIWAYKQGGVSTKTHFGITALDLVKEFAGQRGVTLADLRGPKRKRPLVLHRQDCMLMVKSATKLSLPQIGRLFNRDHTTVLHGIRAAKERRRAAQ